MKIIFITGASGSGKTTLLQDIEQKHSDDFSYYYFDSIGVPSPEEMVVQYGSGEEWQKQTTAKWVERILKENNTQVAILDGQMRLAFIQNACKANNFNNYMVVLVGCDDTARTNRLTKRGQPELASIDMMNWAKYLRAEAVNSNAKILDTSGKTAAESVEALLQIIDTGR